MIDQFGVIDLRVGEVLAVEPVPKSKKLLKFLVDLGFEKRTILSGIALHYPDPQVLVGKKVVVVANLKTAKLMGIDSQGMILSALSGDQLEIVELKSAKPGDEIR